MERHTDPLNDDGFEQEFERNIFVDDDSAARAMLAAGTPIHIVRDDTPQGYIIRISPDGREDVMPMDWDEAVAILGR